MDSLSGFLPYLVALPLFGALINGLAGLSFEGWRRNESLIGTLATISVFIPFVISVYLFMNMGAGDSYYIKLYTWLKAGTFSADVAYRVDALNILMVMVVTGVGSLIHLYSMGYMKGDEGFYKFFAYLNLFIFAMLNLIMGSNLLILFLGWEGVGVCSYLLIGFWYKDQEKAAAGMKAFVYNRVGDFAFLIGTFLIFRQIGSIEFTDIMANLDMIPADLGFWIGLLFLIGATGKSAQLPLFVWLPDAMAGPTPVSALIHAATMVTSGIYLISRMSFLYIANPEVMMIVAAVGALTAVVAATVAITQYDIKKVLAYSTVSQLGFMFLALGSGAFTAAMFHVITHAFFKACLFLGSGSVIHAMHHVEHELHHHGKHVHFDPQDMRFMGGLREYMPSTYKTFLLATIAIAGIPPLAGFVSKDEILMYTFSAGLGGSYFYYALWAVAVITAFMTAFYMFRLTFSTFHGSFKLPKVLPEAAGAEKYLHENAWNMTLPLWVLGVLSVIGGFMGLPNFLVETFTHQPAHLNWLHGWLEPVTAQVPMHVSHAGEWGLMFFSIAVAASAVFLAWKMYGSDTLEPSDAKVRSRFGKLYQVWNDKYNLDEIYEGYIAGPAVRFSEGVLAIFDMKVVDGIVNGVAATVRFFGYLLRYLQTGVIQNYALMLVLGVVVILALLVI